jgi:alkylated DNA repair protein alkB family protein 1
MNEARFAWHGVPKIFPDTCPSYLASWPNDAGQDGPFYKWDEWMTNKRINLNVRQMY